MQNASGAFQRSGRDEHRGETDQRMECGDECGSAVIWMAARPLADRAADDDAEDDRP